MLKFHSRLQPHTSLIGLSLLSASFLISACDQDTVMFGKAMATLNQKAQSYMEAGQTDEAISRLEAALELVPSEKGTLNNLAIAYQANKQNEKAIETFKKLIELVPERKNQYLQSIGISYESIGDQLRARLNEGLESYPRQRACLLGSEIDAQKVVLSKQKAESIQAYKKAIEHYDQVDGLDSKASAQLTQQKKLLQDLIKKVQELKTP